MVKRQKDLSSRRQLLRLLSLTAGFTLNTALTACTTSSNSPSVTSPKTLYLMMGTAELTDADSKLFEKKNPDLKIKQLNYDTGRLSAMFIAGNPPDVIRSSATGLPYFFSRKLATDLEPYIAKSKVVREDDLEPINDVARWDGSVQGKGTRYGLVKDWSQDGMLWFNKKLFDQKKLPYPSSTEPLHYDELLTLGKQLTVKEGERITVYGLDPLYIFNFHYPQIMTNLMQDEKSLFSSDFTKVDFTTSEAKRILTWYVDWGQARIGPSPLDPSSNALDLFSANRLAIVQFGYWFGNFIKNGKNGLQDHVGFAPAPQWGAHRISTCYFANTCWVPQQSKQKNEAWRFLEFFIGGDAARERASGGLGLPALKSLRNQLPTALPFQKQAYETQQNELQYLKVLQYPPYVSDSAIDSAFAKYLDPVIKGQGTVDQAAQQLTDAINLLIQQGKEQIG